MIKAKANQAICCAALVVAAGLFGLGTAGCQAEHGESLVEEPLGTTAEALRTQKGGATEIGPGQYLVEIYEGNYKGMRFKVDTGGGDLNRILLNKDELLIRAHDIERGDPTKVDRNAAAAAGSVKIQCDPVVCGTILVVLIIVDLTAIAVMGSMIEIPTNCGGPCLNTCYTQTGLGNGDPITPAYLACYNSCMTSCTGAPYPPPLPPQN